MIIFNICYIFSLFNTLTTFQQFLNKIVIIRLNVFFIMYYDNILFYINDLS